MPERILVIRRDNIGDLVCTTPLLSALRRHYPAAHIAALVNSYNAPVLAGNPDLDEVCVYQKAKHREAGESKLGVWWRTWRLMLRLRRQGFDLAIVATPARQPEALKFAHWVKARRVVAYGLAADGIDDPLAGDDLAGCHETEAVMRLLQPLGIVEAPGRMTVRPRPELAAAIELPAGEGPLIGLHLSARKPTQRWPVEHFAELVRRLHAARGARFLAFWSPGAGDDPRHPGDDDKAALLQRLCAGQPLALCPTTHLDQLIAGLSRCDRVICSDGGGMHLAAGLGKPLVCLFGNSDAGRWHPWGVAHRLLQPAGRDVREVSVAEVLAAFAELDAELGPAAPAR